MSENKLNINGLGNLDISKYINEADVLSRQMQNINIPKIDHSKLTFPAQEHREEEKMYWEESLRILKSIEYNTANLAVLVDLINKNNEQQDEIIKYIIEILEIAKSKTKVDAESKFMKVMNKIVGLNKNVEAVQKLSAFANTLYTLVISNLDKIEKIGDAFK
jgi:hypothetical protein